MHLFLGGFMMLVVQLQRGVARHAGSRPRGRVERLISPARGISSSSQQLSAPGRTQCSSCTDTDHPKVLITGWFQCHYVSCSLTLSFPDLTGFLLKVFSVTMILYLHDNSFSSLFVTVGGLGQLGVGLAKLLR